MTIDAFCGRLSVLEHEGLVDFGKASARDLYPEPSLGSIVDVLSLTVKAKRKFNIIKRP
jgi:hypothetical protein